MSSVSGRRVSGPASASVKVSGRSPFSLAKEKAKLLDIFDASAADSSSAASRTLGGVRTPVKRSPNKSNSSLAATYPAISRHFKHFRSQHKTAPRRPGAGINLQGSGADSLVRRLASSFANDEDDTGDSDSGNADTSAGARVGIGGIRSEDSDDEESSQDSDDMAEEQLQRERTARMLRQQAPSAGSDSDDEYEQERQQPVQPRRLDDRVVAVMQSTIAREAAKVAKTHPQSADLIVLLLRELNRPELSTEQLQRAISDVLFTLRGQQPSAGTAAPGPRIEVHVARSTEVSATPNRAWGSLADDNSLAPPRAFQNVVSETSSLAEEHGFRIHPAETIPTAAASASLSTAQGADADLNQDWFLSTPDVYRGQLSGRASPMSSASSAVEERHFRIHPAEMVGVAVSQLGLKSNGGAGKPRAVRADVLNSDVDYQESVESASSVLSQQLDRQLQDELKQQYEAERAKTQTGLFQVALSDDEFEDEDDRDSLLAFNTSTELVYAGNRSQGAREPTSMIRVSTTASHAQQGQRSPRDPASALSRQLARAARFASGPDEEHDDDESVEVDDDDDDDDDEPQERAASSTGSERRSTALVRLPNMSSAAAVSDLVLQGTPLTEEQVDTIRDEFVALVRSVAAKPPPHSPLAHTPLSPSRTRARHEEPTFSASRLVSLVKSLLGVIQDVTGTDVDGHLKAALRGIVMGYRGKNIRLTSSLLVDQVCDTLGDEASWADVLGQVVDSYRREISQLEQVEDDIASEVSGLLTRRSHDLNSLYTSRLKRLSTYVGGTGALEDDAPAASDNQPAQPARRFFASSSATAAYVVDDEDDDDDDDDAEAYRAAGADDASAARRGQAEVDDAGSADEESQYQDMLSEAELLLAAIRQRLEATGSVSVPQLAAELDVDEAKLRDLVDIVVGLDEANYISDDTAVLREEPDVGAFDTSIISAKPLVNYPDSDDEQDGDDDDEEVDEEVKKHIQTEPAAGPPSDSSEFPNLDDLNDIMAGANGATTNVDTAPDADSLAVSQGPFARPLEFLSVSPASRKNLHALFQQEQQEQAKWIDDAVDALAKRNEFKGQAAMPPDMFQ